MSYWFQCSFAVIEVPQTSRHCFPCVGMHIYLAMSVWGCPVFDGSIQDIRACQRPRREKWESSVLKGQESHAKLPLFTPVAKWTSLDTDCLPMRSRARSNGTDGMRKRDAAYFYSVHLLPELFLPFPSLPSTASAQCKHAGTWISGLLCVWSTPSEHNERLSSQRYGKYIFKIFRRLVNCSKLGGDAMISYTFIHLTPLFYWFSHMNFH